jgi:hypothetical protein
VKILAEYRLTVKTDEKLTVAEMDALQRQIQETFYRIVSVLDSDARYSVQTEEL